MDASSCFIVELVTEYLQLWREDSLKLQTQDALAIFQNRGRPLLVGVEALQGFLSSFFGLELVDHLTRQKISTFVTPAKGLHTSTNTKTSILHLTLKDITAAVAVRSGGIFKIQDLLYSSLFIGKLNIEI